MKKWTILTDVKIQRLGYKWVGLSTLDDWKKIIVQWWVLPWSIIDCRVIKNKKDYLECKVVSIKKISEEYMLQDKICPHYFFHKEIVEDDWTIWCWWCKWQILKYENQLAVKDDIVLDSFRHLKSHLDNLYMDSIVPSPVEFGYRNKLEYSFGKWDGDRNWSLWFHKQWQFSKIVDIHNCRLVTDKNNNIFLYIKDLLLKSNLPVYEQKSHVWFFRHLAIREWINTSQFLINLSVSDKYFDWDNWKKKLWDSLKNELLESQYLKNNVNTFVITYNNWLADIIKWQDIRTEILWGEWFIYEKLIYSDEVELTFRISPFSFFQTNTNWAQVLFSTAMENIWKDYWLMLDLYCWWGSIWLSFLKMWIAKKLIGIEISDDCIYDAKYNAKINWLTQDSYFASWKAEKLVFEDSYLSQNLENINLVVVDPPREGLHKNVIKFLNDLKKIINYKLLYISCNPVTMASNVEWLIEWWFKIKYLRAVDMFPHTHHMEMIGILN